MNTSLSFKSEYPRKIPLQSLYVRAPQVPPLATASLTAQLFLSIAYSSWDCSSQFLRLHSELCGAAISGPRASECWKETFRKMMFTVSGNMKALLEGYEMLLKTSIASSASPVVLTESRIQLLKVRAEN